MRILGFLSNVTIFNEATTHKGIGLGAVKAELIQKPPSSGPASVLFIALC